MAELNERALASLHDMTKIFGDESAKRLDYFFRWSKFNFKAKSFPRRKKWRHALSLRSVRRDDMQRFIALGYAEVRRAFSPELPFRFYAVLTAKGRERGNQPDACRASKAALAERRADFGKMLDEGERLIRAAMKAETESKEK